MAGERVSKNGHEVAIPKIIAILNEISCTSVELEACMNIVIKGQDADIPPATIGAISQHLVRYLGWLSDLGVSMVDEGQVVRSANAIDWLYVPGK